MMKLTVKEVSEERDDVNFGSQTIILFIISSIRLFLYHRFKRMKVKSKAMEISGDKKRDKGRGHRSRPSIAYS